MRVIIKGHKLSGNLKIISSKSYSHRAIIAASLAKGTSVIDDLYFSNDVLATLEIVKKMGAKVIQKENQLIIEGINEFKKNDLYSANDSGSTLRFLLPVLLINDNEFVMEGNNNLVKRPLDVYFKIFDQMGISYSHKENNLPLYVKGKLKSGNYVISDLNSSQFITGLLYSLPLLDGDSKIEIKGKIESLSYIKMTIQILNKFGIEIIEEGNSYLIKGNQQFRPANIKIEGDYSQAAFFLVSNLLGNDVSVSNLDSNSLQADKAILKILASLGANIDISADKISVSGSLKNNQIIDLADCPDLGPILFTLAATLDKETKFINTKRLRIKESDRVLDIKEELEKIGAKFIVSENEVIVIGTKNLEGDFVFETHKDHRIVMSLAILATALNGNVTINGVEDVKKSYPTFFEDYKTLGGVLE